MKNTQKKNSLKRELYQHAIIDSFRKLNPRIQIHNPVMFVVEIGSILTTGLWIQALAGFGEAPTVFIGAIAIWLWFTVLFANFSEALAEGRGKAQAEALRKTRQETNAKKLPAAYIPGGSHENYSITPSTILQSGDKYLVEAGDVIPADGEVVEGIASVDEAAVTGELPR